MALLFSKRSLPARAAGMFFLVLTLAGLLSASAARAGARDFGDLSLKNLEGQRVSLAELRGKVVVLNFWATWCKPCVAEMPLLAGLAERYHGRGVIVIAASVDESDSRGAVESLAGRLPAGMDVWVGATLADMHRLEVGDSLPVTVLLDRDGRAQRVHHGAIEEDSFGKLIESMLGKGPEKEKEKEKLPGVTEACARRAAGEAPSL